MIVGRGYRVEWNKGEKKNGTTVIALSIKYIKIYFKKITSSSKTSELQKQPEWVALQHYSSKLQWSSFYSELQQILYTPRP